MDRCWHGIVGWLGVMEGDHMKELQDCSGQYKRDFQFSDLSNCDVTVGILILSHAFKVYNYTPKVYDH